MIGDFILFLIVSGAIEILVVGVSFAECNALSDAVFLTPVGVEMAFCDPVSGVSA